MGNFIEFIQKLLEQIKDIEVSSSFPDEFIKKVTNVAYQCSRMMLNKQTGKSEVWRYNVTINIWGDTLKIADQISNNIVDKLKEFNFDCDIEDMGMENSKRRLQIQSTVIWSSLNKNLYNQGGY